MAIKRIQLRGISRTPSDRMNSDGGVAESLNAYINENESAPMPQPKDKAESLGLPTYVGDGSLRAVYIHRANNEDHFLYVRSSDNVEKLIAYPEGRTIFTTSQGEKFIDETITSIGNTLVFSTTSGNGYAIFRDGEYKYLGREIPQPVIHARPSYYGGNRKLNHYVNIYGPSTTAPENDATIGEFADLFKASSSAWNTELGKDESQRSGGISMICKAFWDGVQEDLLGSDYFRYPVFVRYALKLYDGSYVYHTVPVLLGSGVSRGYNAQLKYIVGSNGRQTTYTTQVSIEQEKFAYKILTTLGNPAVFDPWTDVVKSIDMFISVPVIYPEINSEIVACDGTSSTTSGVTSLGVSFQNANGSDDEKEAFRDALLDATRTFYKVRSFNLDNTTELVNGYELKNDKQLSYVENLATHEELPDDFRTNNSYFPSLSYTVNRRILSVGMSEKFGRGMESLYGVYCTTRETTVQTVGSYRFCYEIVDNDGKTRHVYGSGEFFTPSLNVRTYNSGGTATDTSYNSDMSQIIFYPDTRCKHVYVIRDDGQAVKLDMKSHPYLNCAYYIGDISKPLSQLTFSTMTLPGEDRDGSSYESSYLFQSTVENPFVYPVNGRIRLPASLITVATISSALSEGQFGQFDLYAFTDRGIWALSTADDGTYTNVKPVSRDVILSASSVRPIDKAVAFITSKGVMLIDGSQITCLSSAMNGRHYSIDEPSLGVLMKSVAGKCYWHALQDETPFMKFMEGAVIAYDYKGSRLIFINPSYNYEYVYMLATDTWHKCVMDTQSDNSSLGSVKVLNSYPECYMSCADANGGHHMYDWATILDVADNYTENVSVIISRPFDLDEPDVLKTISHLRIRGQFEREGRTADMKRRLHCDGNTGTFDDDALYRIFKDYKVDPLSYQMFINGSEDVDISHLSHEVADVLVGTIVSVTGLIVRQVWYIGTTDAISPRVQYILLGSQDGINFQRLGSLRGKSWKMFRIIVVAQLRPNERISWIDLDYETRFTNRLR